VDVENSDLHSWISRQQWEIFCFISLNPVNNCNCLVSYHIVMTKHGKAFTSFFLSLFFCIQTNILLGQNNTTYSKEAQAKIKQFEKNLGLWVQIGNQPFTLADRMKSNHVNGVSIALIKNYKIEWAVQSANH